MVTELKVTDPVTDLILDELSRVTESKSLASLKGHLDPDKLQQSTALQSPRFKRSVRGHARAATKRLNYEVDVLYKHLKSAYDDYVDDEISFKRFRSRLRIAIKSSTELAFQLGAKSAGHVQPSGELRPLTPQERKWLDSYFKEELSYLDKFLRDVAKGQSERKSELRLQLYASTIKAAYNSGRVLSVGTNVIIHWILESDNPCPDCKLLHRMSPYTVDSLPTVPKGGQTRCISRCACSLKLVQASQDKIDSLKKRKNSSSWHLKKLKANRKRR